MIILFKKFFRTIGYKRKIKMTLLIFCMLLSSFFELISVAMFIPLISILLDIILKENVSLGIRSIIKQNVKN